MIDLKEFAKKRFSSADCIVVKIGSSLLIDNSTNLIREEWLHSIASDVADLISFGKKVVIVSSGSIALGSKLLGLKSVDLSLEESQAAAAVGQINLAQSYQKILKNHKITSAQILVTAEDSRSRRRYLNSRATILKLLDMGVVPIVNENDTVATDEIRFGDNDRLAAQVASLCDAHILVLLSDVDGLFESDPHLTKNTRLIPFVDQITDEIENMVDDRNNSISKGGMRTKIEAAKVSVAAGCHLIITNGKTINPLKKVINGGLATWFVSHDDPIASRKQWIFNTKAKGKIFIDEGAQSALYRGKSLLPAGVIRIEGQFERGDTVGVVSSSGKFLANGLTD